jgi:ubiquinol-cytochrome c reductase cytochrome b subunit
MSATKRLGDWLDERTGYREGIKKALDEDVLGGARFAYVFGSVLTFLLVLQMTTGVFLAMYYSPSATDAWASVAFLQDQVSAGWFIRGLHSHGASAMVIVAGLHLLQVAIFGAYKKPRELNWIIGVLMLGLLLAFALTGYLLPWDQTGYWATQVATGIAGSSPIIGAQVQEALQAGNGYGNLTITRFFALHVFVLPAALIGLTLVHLTLFRKHHQTPPWWLDEKQLKDRTQPFWPDQMFKDMVAMALVFAALVALNFYTQGAPLDAPADPSTAFDARPEWYFRPLFQGLKYFHGIFEVIVALGAPVLVGGALLALPFVDRGPDRSPKKRLPYLAVLAVGVAVTAVLTILSFAEDRNNPNFQEAHRLAHESSEKARMLARTYGVPPQGGPAVFTMEPGYRGQQLFARDCAGCHVGSDRKGPEIIEGYNNRQWIADFFRSPSANRFFGVTKLDDMEPVKETGEDFDALVELIYAQSGADDVKPALVTKGQALFDDGSCSDCHSIDWETEEELGPNLGRRGSPQMLREFIIDPDHLRWFGKRNEMPSNKGKYSENDMRELVNYLIGLRDKERPKR